MTRRQVRPLDALDSQVSLVRALANPSIGAEIMGAAQGIPNASQTVEREGRYIAKVMREALDTMPTIVVTDRMLDRILERLPAIEFGQPLQPEDVSLFPSGYVVLPRPVVVPGITDDDAYGTIPPRVAAQFDAGFWIPSTIVARGTANALVARHQQTTHTAPALDVFDDHVDGIMYTQSVSVGLAERILTTDHVNGLTDDAFDWAQIQHGITRLRNLGVKHAPVYTSGWGFGLSWDPELREPDYVLTAAGEFERRFWITLWRTLGEEVVAPVSLPRPNQRRAKRMLGQVPDVIVADLRRVRRVVHEERTDDGATIMWRYRWKVREHDRTLHRGTPQERVVRVREHIKGPEHLPLLEKDTVYRLSR